MINIMTEFRSAPHAFSATGKGLDWMSVTGFILSLMGHSCPLLRPWTSAKNIHCVIAKIKYFIIFSFRELAVKIDVKNQKHFGKTGSNKLAFDGPVN